MRKHLTSLEEYNLQTKISKLDILTDREMDSVLDSIKWNKQHIHNTAYMIFKLKDGVDLDNTKQFNKFQKELFANFKFSVRQNGRDDIGYYGRQHHSYKNEFNKSKEEFLSSANYFYKRLHDIGDIKVGSKEVDNRDNPFVDEKKKGIHTHYYFENELTGYKIKEQHAPRDYWETNYTLVKLTTGSGVDLESETKYLFYEQTLDCSNEDNQKDLRDNLEKQKNSKFFKFLNDYFYLEDEEITNIINQ